MPGKSNSSQLGELFDLRTSQVIKLRHVSKSLTCRYLSLLLGEDSHEVSEFCSFRWLRCLPVSRICIQGPNWVGAGVLDESRWSCPPVIWVLATASVGGPVEVVSWRS
jgi:hypothetical protein